MGGQLHQVGTTFTRRVQTPGACDWSGARAHAVVVVVLRAQVVITYGSGDHITRVWRASLQDVLSTFTQDMSGAQPVNSTALAQQRQAAAPAPATRL